MRTVSIPLAAVKGPSREMVVALLDAVIDAINTHSEIFEYSIEDALSNIHEEIDFSIQVLSAIYPDIIMIDYMLVFNGTTCDFMPCNDYTQEAADIMQSFINP